ATTAQNNACARHHCHVVSIVDYIAAEIGCYITCGKNCHICTERVGSIDNYVAGRIHESRIACDTVVAEMKRGSLRINVIDSGYRVQLSSEITNDTCNSSGAGIQIEILR